MCGLVGIAGALAYKDEATMQRLLLLNYFRGTESTGLAAIRNDGTPHIAKMPSHPIDLFDYPKFKAALTGSTSKVFLGHNRAATRGLVSTYNAHPFEFDNIVGAHNGTLDTKSTTLIEDTLGEKYSVDSMAVFASIEALGIGATIAMMTEGRQSHEGAWALTWYDKKDDTLNFLRNKHRPLWYAYTKEFDRIFWASEWRMIDSAVNMSGAGYELYVDKDGHRFFPFGDDLHYKYEVSAFKQADKPPKPKVKEIKGKEAPALVSTIGNDPFDRQAPMGFGHHGRSSGVTQIGSTTTSLSKVKDKTDVMLLHLEGNDAYPFAGFISRERFEDITRQGCGWCYEKVEYTDVGLTVIDRDDKVLCAGCSTYYEGNVPASRVLTYGASIEQLL